MKKKSIKKFVEENIEKFPDDFQYQGFFARTYNCKSHYKFERQRKFFDFTVYEILRLIPNIKHMSFSCSVASQLSRYESTWEYDNWVNNGTYFINPSKNSNPFERISTFSHTDILFSYNDCADSALENILSLIPFYKTEFLDTRLTELEQNKGLQQGLLYVQNLDYEPEKLWDEFIAEFRKCENSIPKNQHPVFLELVSKINSKLTDSEKPYEIVSEITAFNLIRLFCKKTSKPIR